MSNFEIHSLTSKLHDELEIIGLNSDQFYSRWLENGLTEIGEVAKIP